MGKFTPGNAREHAFQQHFPLLRVLYPQDIAAEVEKASSLQTPIKRRFGQRIPVLSSAKTNTDVGIVEIPCVPNSGAQQENLLFWYPTKLNSKAGDENGITG